MEKIILQNCWERKYIDHSKDFIERSLNGNITTYYDKYGAFMLNRNTFGVGDRLYDCELDYIEAIKHLITTAKYAKLLKNRDKTNEEQMYEDFNELEEIIEYKKQKERN